MVEVVVSDRARALDVLRARLAGHDRVQLFGDRLHVQLADADATSADVARALADAGVAVASLRGSCRRSRTCSSSASRGQPGARDGATGGNHRDEDRLDEDTSRDSCR